MSTTSLDGTSCNERGDQSFGFRLCEECAEDEALRRLRATPILRLEELDDRLH